MYLFQRSTVFPSLSRNEDEEEGTSGTRKAVPARNQLRTVRPSLFVLRCELPIAAADGGEGAKES